MMYWIVHSIIILTLSFLALKVSKSQISAWVFWVGLSIKLLAGIILGLIFYQYYGLGDTIIFFEAANHQDLTNRTGQPRSDFFITLIRPIVKLSGGSYWITSLWLSFISFVSCWYLVITLSQLYPKIKAICIISFLFIPSIVFWSSGIIKDSIAFSSVAILIVILQIFHESKRIRILELILALLSAFILLKLKHYLFIVVTIYAAAIFTLKVLNRVPKRWKLIATVLVLSAGFIGTQNIHPYLKIDRLAWTLYQNNQAILKKTDPENRLDIEIENESWSAVINEIPDAIHIGLFRPSFFDTVPIWGTLHQVENLILTTLIFSSIILLFKTDCRIDRPMIIGAIFCILMLATLLPLSTPNFGTLVRYKNAYLPFLFLLSSILPYHYLSSKEEE